MKLPVQIGYRRMDKSAAIERRVALWVARLEKIAPDLVRCAVVIEAPHRQHRQGNLFHVRVRLTLAGGGVVAARQSGLDHAHADPFVAIRDAFRAARRELADRVRVRRGQIKEPAGASRGRVTRLLSGEGPGFRYGFLETRDGRAIYFHEKSVVDGFDRLRRGAAVRFVEERGEAGPQASTVHRAHARAR
jgi:cold shock CspA family protein